MKAFTLLEVLVCLAIVAIVAAFATPAFLAAKEKSKITASLGRLHQLQMAVMIYRADDDQASDYAVESFPPFDYVYSTYLGFGEDFFRSPCGYKPGIEDNLKHISYQYTPYPIMRASHDYFAKYGPKAVLFRDCHCNDAISWNSAYLMKRGLAVTVEGTLLNIYKRGTPLDDWWTQP